MSWNRQRNSWYKDFYTKFYLTYFHRKKEDISKTKKEISFICNVLKLPKKAKILDLACGPGRHALELSQRKFDVTGVDFNKQFLKIAHKKAQERGLPLKLIQCDMRFLPFQDEFDAIICMYTSFGYFIKERENVKVLRAVLKSLKREGLFLLDLPNKKWTLNNVSGKTWQKIKNEYVLENRSFDKKRKIFKNEITILSLKGRLKTVCTFLHLYDLQEIRNKLKSQGFKILKIYGDYDTKVKFDCIKSPRMIILAKKS